MIACDLVAVRSGIQEKLREKLGPLLPGVDLRKIFLSATHTHTAPVTMELKSNPFLYEIPTEGVMQPDAYVEFLVERLAQVAQVGFEHVQLVMMVMTDQGMRHLMANKFQIGAAAYRRGGPDRP